MLAPSRKIFKNHDEKDLTLSQVFNCNETGLHWKLIPNKTLVSSREKEGKGFRKLKDCFTLMACANASGLIKLLLCSFTNTQPMYFKTVEKNDLLADYYAKYLLDGILHLQSTVL